MAEEKGPYRQTTSIIYYAFKLAVKGVKEQHLLDTVRHMGGSPPRILKVLKRGHDSKGVWSWDIEEHNGYLKILNVRSAKVQPASQTTSKRKK